jgi:hypothetical protein
MYIIEVFKHFNFNQISAIFTIEMSQMPKNVPWNFLELRTFHYKLEPLKL